MPQAQVIAVIAFACRSGKRSPVPKIGGCGRIYIFVISERGPGPVFEPAPGCAVAVLKLRSAAVFIGQVAGGKHSAGNLLDQFGGGLCAFDVLAAGDVSGADQGVRLVRVRLVVCRFRIPLR